jgi:pilus assembly protein CpaC
MKRCARSNRAIPVGAASWTVVGLLVVAGLALAVAGVSRATEQAEGPKPSSADRSGAISIRLRQVPASKPRIDEPRTHAAPAETDVPVEPASAEVWVESDRATQAQKALATAAVEPSPQDDAAAEVKPAAERALGNNPAEENPGPMLRILTPEAEPSAKSMAEKQRRSAQKTASAPKETAPTATQSTQDIQPPRIANSPEKPKATKKRAELPEARSIGSFWLKSQFLPIRQASAEQAVADGPAQAAPPRGPQPTLAKRPAALPVGSAKPAALKPASEPTERPSPRVAESVEETGKPASSRPTMRLATSSNRAAAPSEPETGTDDNRPRPGNDTNEKLGGAATTALVTDDPRRFTAEPIGTQAAKGKANSPKATPQRRSSRVALLQQPTPAQPQRQADPQGEPSPPPQMADAEKLGVFDVLDHTEELTVVLRRSKLLRTKVDIYRTSVVDSSVCDVVQFTPREVSIIGRSQGATHVTFWFEDESYQPQTYLVRVVPDPEVQERREEQYGILEEILAELFPSSKVELTPMSDKLIVRGQARDAAEAAQIMAVIRGEAVDRSGRLVSGTAATPFGEEETGGAAEAPMVINMLRVPGVPQVALKVKIAELNRSAARNFGVHVNTDITFDDGSILLQSLLNPATAGATNFLGTFDADKLKFGFNYLQRHGVVRLLSEPTLVTISGRPASFIAGGEFAVPTTVGVGGASAVTTDFRSFGAIITFLPTVLDKDLVRLEVAPEFSKIDEDLQNSSSGVPGLQTRAVTTTVEMREGQTLAIAGLLEDSMNGTNAGDLPFVAKIFGKREMNRSETELLILVTPELVHPMEPEAVPPLPGFDVTEPTNCEFFLKGRLEGRPTHEYRSTIWPQLRRRYQAGGPAMISGPFGHGN